MHACMQGSACSCRLYCKCTLSFYSSLFTEDALQELRKKGLAASSKKVRRPLVLPTGCNACSVARGSVPQVATSLTPVTALQASRNAAQGLVGLASEGDAAVLVEVNRALDCSGCNAHTATQQIELCA